MRTNQILCQAPLCVDTINSARSPSGAQFGKQTDFVFDKRALNGMTPFAGLECMWIDAFPGTVQFQILWSTSTLMIHQANMRRNNTGSN